MRGREQAIGVATAASAELASFCAQAWDAEIMGLLSDYIAIPAKSPMFDPNWQANGYLDRVICDAAKWIEGKHIAGATVEVLRLPGRTPLLFFDIPGTQPAGGNETVCLYGHLDKQPEFAGWRANLGPWTPRYIDGLLYGRGGADDGYAVYAAITAIRALDHQGIARPRCVGIIESCEESGSTDLPAYLEILLPRMGRVELVVCLDSGAGNYEQLWLTTSLRGMVTGVLTVEVLSEGVHSGDSSGIIPSSFRIMRHLIERLEDSANGELLPAEFHCEVPGYRLPEIRAAAAILGDTVWKRFPWTCNDEGGSMLPTTTDPAQALLNRTWRPALSVTGAEGFPAIGDAGNVMRPYTAFKLSLRLPPLVDGHAAAVALKRRLEADAPYGARVTFRPDGPAEAPGTSGWNAPDLAPWLEQALNAASHDQFGAACGYLGEGGTIPLMSMLKRSFPRAQMMVCGVLGPKSNAHGPNEFLHVPYAKKLTACVAQVISASLLPVATGQ